MWAWGWRTAVLTVVSVQALAVAMALLKPARNRIANRFLASLLSVVVGVLTPFTLGYAGAYDVWPWLSFAPFAVTLAVGPLLYGYAHALATGHAPRRWGLHLASPAAQFAYLAACFVLPSALKAAWNARVHEAWIEPALHSAALLSLGAYAVAVLRLLRRYRAHLADQVADPPRYAAAWLGRVATAALLLLLAWAAFRAWEAVFGRLSYDNSFVLYLALSAVALYLAAEGWRYADLAFPSLEEVSASRPAVRVAASRDWRAAGERWATQAETDVAWRDPELTLAGLAARLGTNTGHLSRALNEGLGVNFATFVNGLRARAVAQALRAGRPGDLLTLALEEGFSSKASFNRAFQAEFGLSPSAYRRAHGSEAKSLSANPVLRRSGS